MLRVNSAVRRRKSPLVQYNSTLLLKPGTDITLIPSNSEIRYSRGHWEAHTPLTNKKILKKLAKRLDAVAFLC